MATPEPDDLPKPEELDTPEESPYLRRRLPSPVRRRRMPWRWRVLLWVVAVVAPIGLVAYGVVRFALNSPHFVLTSPDDVAVTGNHYVSREEVIGALGIPLTGDARGGANVIRLSLEARRHEVETLPWVRSASVTRVLPHGLLIHITERVAVAYASFGGRVSLVDEDGMILEKPEGGAFDFPVLTGLENLASAGERRARLVLYLEFMRQLGVEAPRAGWMISEIDLSDAEDMDALLISGQQSVKVHFGEKEFLPRFRSFLSLLPELRQADPPVDSVDLRYRNQVVFAPKRAAPDPEPPVGKRRTAAPSASRATRWQTAGRRLAGTIHLS